MATKKNVSTGALATAAVGVAVGAGLGAAAVALSDQKTRKKLTKKAAGVTKKAGTSLEIGKKELNNAVKAVSAKGAEIRKTLKKGVAKRGKTSTTVQKTTKKAAIKKATRKKATK